MFVTRQDSGGWALRGRLDPETGQLFAVVLDALAKPQPSTQSGPDPRTAALRRADGLVEIPYATLVRKPGAGTASYADGTPLSASTARRLACDDRQRSV